MFLEIPGPTRTQTASWPGFFDEEEELDAYGSAEFEKSDIKQISIDNTVYGQAGVAHPTVFWTSTPAIKLTKKRPTFIVSSSTTINHETYLLMVVTVIILQLSKTFIASTTTTTTTTTTSFEWH